MVITTNIRVNRTARRLEEYVDNYAGGGSEQVKEDVEGLRP
jgi:hypothetical protein